MVLNVSSSELVLILIVAVAQALLGYFLSEADARRLGRTPWGMPSLVWALLWFLSWILGLVLYLVAHRAEVRRAAQGPGPTVQAQGNYAAAPSGPQPTANDFPAYPRPADGGPVRPVPPAPPAPPAPPEVIAASAPPSWQPDPGGRHHYRWWSGTEWTSYVSTAGQVVVDTSPDQRIGPY
jgi:hypothetical protein